MGRERERREGNMKEPESLRTENLPENQTENQIENQTENTATNTTDTTKTTTSTTTTDKNITAVMNYKEGWVRLMDVSTGYYYWLNPHTQESYWDTDTDENTENTIDTTNTHETTNS